MLNNQFKCFTIQTSTNNESTLMNKDLNLFVEENQNELIIENEIMQNDNYMILFISFI